ncbi:MAG: threonine/serine exporter family protein [Halanaerobiales bacterium]|nr:threonine/serine exporter family protein [Halanaerobiales bacterium]
MLTSKQVLDIAGIAGQIILSNGGEIYRTEDTITRICKAYGIPFVQSVVTPTGIFISVDNKDSISQTLVLRIHRRNLNLTKISDVNAFSRNLQSNLLDYQNAMNKLNEINDAKNVYRVNWVIFLSSFGGSMNVLLAKVSIINIIPAFLASLFAQIVIKKIGFLKEVNFVPQLIAGFIAGFISLVCFENGLGDQLSIIIVSSILPFVPGVSITNAIRDAISGDLISANSRGIEALLIAISLAVGVALALGVFQV